MRTMSAMLLLMTLGAWPAWSHEGEAPKDLKQLPKDHHVQSVTYCSGAYTVALADGETRQFTEFNLRMKVDSGENGPAPGSPVIIPSGMMGDRAFLVFAGPGEISPFIKAGC